MPVRDSPVSSMMGIYEDGEDVGLAWSGAEYDEPGSSYDEPSVEDATAGVGVIGLRRL